MINEASKYKLSKFISTFFYVGLAPKGPGTVGSLAAFPFVWAINQIIINVIMLGDKFDTIDSLVELMSYHFVGIVILFVIGVITSDIYSKYSGKSDPKEVVIDEVVGQWLLIWLTVPASLVLLEKVPGYIQALILFALFRVFDIFKPWPIKWLDRNIKGGIGIMVDDIAASILAALTFYGIFYIAIDLWK